MPDAVVDRILSIERELKTSKSGKGVGITTVDFSTANTSNPPTDAQLDTAFGTPSDYPGGSIVGMVDDNGADTAVYLIATNGTSWWVFTGTKAT